MPLACFRFSYTSCQPYASNGRLKLHQSSPRCYGNKVLWDTELCCWLINVASYSLVQVASKLQRCIVVNLVRVLTIQKLHAFSEVHSSYEASTDHV